jgi:hypothetical protein
LKIIEALPIFYKYVKEQYILKHLGISAKTDDFLQDYYNITKDKTSKQQIGKYLTALDIKPKNYLIMQVTNMKKHIKNYMISSYQNHGLMKQWI